MVRLPNDIEMYIRRVFAPDQVEEVLELLDGATIHDGTMAGPRLLRCALVAGNGSLEGLRNQLAGLKCDYRDVIVAAEYVCRNGDLVQVRDLSQPFEANDA